MTVVRDVIMKSRVYKQTGVLQLIIIFSLMLAPFPSWGNFESLQARYMVLKDVLKESKFDTPIYINSKVSRDILTGEVYWVVKNPKVTFDMLSEAFTKLENWCEFIPLHLNVKTCIYSYSQSSTYLTFYVGRKQYALPDDVFAVRYRFQVINKNKNYFKVLLTANKGPARTRNYRLQLDAMKINGHVYYRMISSYRPSGISRLGTNIYLKTSGSKKVGFSVIGADREGKPIYVRGIKGVIERNVIRYYLAGKTYILTQRLPVDKRFEARIKNWYDETERYHRQLFEMNKTKYLKAKRKERANQIALQKTIIYK